MNTTKTQSGSSLQRVVLPPCEWHGCYAKCGMPARYEMMDENWANAIPICSKHQSQASSLGWQTRVRQNDPSSVIGATNPKI